MSVRKFLAAFLVIIVAVGGFLTGLYLLRQRQDLGEEAAVPGGEATVSLNPDTGNYDVGDTIQTGVYFNSAGIPISGVMVKILYPFNGTTPEVTVSSIVVSANLLSSGDWTCPVQNSKQEGTNVVVEIACANTSAAGFVASTDTLLANLSLKINSAPETSPLTVRFDPAESVITRRSDNKDILLIPTSTGTYYIEGVSGISATPTNPAATGSPTVTVKATATPTKKLTTTTTTTLTPTTASLPDAGVGTPALLGAGFGVLVMAVAIILAL